MTRNVLLLGRTGIVLDEVREHLGESDVNLFAGTNLDDVNTAFEAETIDTVIMGAGIELAVRLQIVDHIFATSTSTTVHMKDWDSGPQGMLPFVRGILGAARP